jgi:hypothetical protein
MNRQAAKDAKREERRDQIDSSSLFLGVLGGLAVQKPSLMT